MTRRVMSRTSSVFNGLDRSQAMSFRQMASCLISSADWSDVAGRQGTLRSIERVNVSNSFVTRLTLRKSRERSSMIFFASVGLMLYRDTECIEERV
jgi:hypothetical protein